MMKVAEIKVSYNMPNNNRVKIQDSNTLYKIALQHWNIDTMEMQEEIKVLLLNRANEVLGIYELSKGGMSGTVLDIKLLLSVVLKCLASGIALIHNHPSGNLKPSEADIKITQKVKEACAYLDLTLLDHIIISKENYYSFSDDGSL